MRSKAIHFISSALLLTTLLVTQAVSSVANAVVNVQAQTAIGSQHVVALGSNGTVWTWGSLVPGPTGVGSKDVLRSPTNVLLPAGRTAVGVAATYNASFAVANDGTVWAWGSLGRGLGDAANTTDARYDSPIKVSFPVGVSIVELSAACEGVLGRASNGDVYQWGYFYGNWYMSFSVPEKLAGVSGATSVSRGCSSSFAIVANGSALAWGSNGGGRLGDGTTTDRATPTSISLPSGKTFAHISTAQTHTLAIANDGTLYGWGGNSNGQLAADPNSLAYSATPRSIAIGSGRAVAVAASDSSPFSTVVTSANSVLKWGGWGTTEYVPSPMSLPTADLASRTLVDVTSNQNIVMFVASDNSLWVKGGWSTVDFDGNCGANASDYAMWRNGATVSSRPLVRTTSIGQFGASFSEDEMSIAKMETGSGAVLPLDGGGTAIGSVGVASSVILTSPVSACFSVDRLSYEISLDNGTTWSDEGVVVATNSFAQTIVTLPYTPTLSGRRRAFVRVSNPDGQQQSYRFNLGIAAAVGSGTPIAAAALPIVETYGGTTLSIGADGFLYAWGTSTFITGAVGAVVTPKRLIPSSNAAITPTTTTTTTIPSTTTTSTTSTTVAMTTTTSTTIPDSSTSSVPVGTTTTTVPPTTTSTTSTTVAIMTTTTVAPTTTTTVAPVVEDMSTLKFKSISLAAPNDSTSNLAAAAVSEDGRLFVWGKGTDDLILGKNQNVSTPTQLKVQDNRKISSVVLSSSWSCFVDSCSAWRHGLFGFALDESGSLLAWGGGEAVTNKYAQYARYGGTPSPIAALAGTSYVSMRPSNTSGVLYEKLLLRTSSGEVSRWDFKTVTYTTSCSSTCVYTFANSAPVVIGTFSSGFIVGNNYSPTGSSYGFFDINSAGKVVFTPIDSSGVLGVNELITLPNGRTAKELTGNGLALANDGTIWNVSQSKYSFYETRVPLLAKPVTRFASSSYIVGSTGHLFALNPYGTPSGSCATNTDRNYYYSSDQTRRVASTGQFGPAFTEDSFMVGLDSPRERNFLVGAETWGREPRPGYDDSGQFEPLYVRPGVQIDLFSYFKSQCEIDSSKLTVKWDLNDDGEFETTGTAGAVEKSTTYSTTARAASPDQERQAYDGLPDAYRQSKVTLSASNIGGALLQGGGRFLGLQVTSPYGTTKQRIPVIAVPEKPSGRVGVSVNTAARFTDSAEVEIGVVWPEGATSMVIANDGSFSDAVEVPVAPKVRWNLPSGGSGLLASTVYVRFSTLSGYDGAWSNYESEYNYTDDIVLDLSPPEVSSVSAASGETAQARASSEFARSLSVERLATSNAVTQTALVSLSALDAVSGVAAVQITSDPAVPGPERAYSRQFRVAVDRGTVAVRAKDNVGHWSDWQYARVSGFVATPEAPSVVPVSPEVVPPAAKPSKPEAAPSVEKPESKVPASVEVSTPAVAVPEVAPSQPSTVILLNPFVAAIAKVPTSTATAVLKGKTASISVSVPSSLAKTCTTKVVKGKKVSTCKAAAIVVSVSGGATKTYSAKSGSNAFKMPAKKGATVTIKVGGKVIKKIKL